MDVDEARGDEPSLGVDLAPPHLLDAAVIQPRDLADHVAGDRDIGDERGRARAIDDGSSSDDDLRSHVLPRTLMTDG